MLFGLLDISIHYIIVDMLFVQIIFNDDSGMCIYYQNNYFVILEPSWNRR